MLLGLGMAGYGVYLVIGSKGLSVMSGLALALGLVDAAMGMSLVCCGHASLFYLRLYGMVVGLLELAQISVAVLFIVPQTQGRILDTIAPPDNLRAWIQANIELTGYVLLGIVGFQAIALLLVFVQACYVDRAFDEDAVADGESLLGNSSGSYLSTWGYSRKDDKRADRFGALADEEAGAPVSAADRYRSKAEKYYESEYLPYNRAPPSP